ncbi:HET domain-containing protein [Pyrenophora tritici-repentis]|nr:HET domain-containing protein [Pyrenophora tritici-repentis]KAF7452671.1 HET domain containing protein [Pyrenophora tritici-repentis]
MSREIAGPQWGPLPEDEELDLFRAILDGDDEEPDQTSKRFDLIRSAMPFENTRLPRSGYTNDSGQPVSCALPQDAGFSRNPPDIGDWPRRLLHVPTMTSVEWVGNDSYSYPIKDGDRVLGRYIIKKPDKHDRESFRRWKKLPALKVNNIPWDIPRVKAEYITVKDFQAVIKAASQSLSTGRVDFVWLDVACISQEDNDSDKNLEIGRQASIFTKAEAVVIWLHQQSSTDLSNSLQNLMAPENDLSRLHTTVDWFLADKWFSSLWTYQEAYLSQDCAWFSSRSGEVNPSVSLSQLVTRCARIGADLEQHFASVVYSTPPSRTRDQKFREEIYQMLSDHGILALAQRSPFALYSASWGRQTQKDYDRIYGIQQVFRFRVGTSVEGSDPDAKYTLLTLEAQLGRLLLENEPVKSQLHVFEEPVMQGCGWHISPTSRIPQWGFPRPLLEYQFTRFCSLSAYDGSIGGQSTVIAQYTSYLQELSSLQARWRNADERHLTGSSEFRSVHKISLDVVKSSLPVPGEKPEYRTWGHRRDDLSGFYQHQLSAWLGAQASAATITVLLLGEFHVETVGKHYCGMLLQNEGCGRPRRRIGVCAWRAEATGAWASQQSGTFV